MHYFPADMQICTIFVAFLLLGYSSGAIPNEPCKLDPWQGGKITNPAAIVRVNSNGIDVASALSMDNVTNFLKKLQAPDIKILDLTIYGIRVSDFQPPNYFRKLVRPNTLRWGFDQGQLAISGGFKHVVRALPIPGLSLDEQTLEANITVASGSTSMETVSLIAKDAENRPTLLSVSCTATLGILNVTVTGNTVLASISDFIQRMIIDQIQRTFQALVCTSTSSLMKENINNVLKTYPAKNKLDGSNLILDYGLTENPKVVNNDQSIEALPRGVVYYRFPSVFPFYPPSVADVSNNQSMLEFYMTDYVVNTLLFTANKEKLLNFEATAKTLSSHALDNYLALSCPSPVNGSFCVGEIFPKASEIGGTDSYVKASMKFLESPKATFADNVAYWTGQAMLNLDLIDNKNKTTKLFSANSTCMYGSLTPELFNSTIYAIVNITSLPFNSFDSPVNDVDSYDLKKLRTIFTSIFEEVINGIARIGFPLPLVDGVTLTNSTMQLLNRTFYLNSNFTFKLPSVLKNGV